MTDALDIAVVELTNTGPDPLTVSLVSGTASRAVATIAASQTMLLATPTGAAWSFSPTTAAQDGQQDVPPDEDVDGRGGKMVH